MTSSEDTCLDKKQLSNTGFYVVVFFSC